MTFQISQLDYTSLLDQPDLQAFVSAISTRLAVDFNATLSRLSVTLGLPVLADSTEPTLTSVPLVSTQPAQPQPEAIQYMRLDLGAYLTDRTPYLSVDDAVDATTVAAWFQRVQNLWFDPTKLTLSTMTADPDPLRTDRQVMTLTVDPSNYLWVGQAMVYVVAVSHLALVALPGVAKGLLQTDVLAVV